MTTKMKDLTKLEAFMFEFLRDNAEAHLADFAQTITCGANEGYRESSLYRDWIPKVFPQSVVRYYAPEPGVLAAVPEGTLRELLIESALAYAALRHAKCGEFGNHQLVFEGLLEVWNILHSEEMVEERRSASASGWHGTTYYVDVSLPHSEALLDSYRQGQKAKLDGKACGCDQCLSEAAQRSLETPPSVKKSGPPLFGDLDEDIPF